MSRAKNRTDMSIATHHCTATTSWHHMAPNAHWSVLNRQHPAPTQMLRGTENQPASTMARDPTLERACTPAVPKPLDRKGEVSVQKWRNPNATYLSLPRENLLHPDGRTRGRKSERKRHPHDTPRKKVRRRQTTVLLRFVLPRGVRG